MPESTNPPARPVPEQRTPPNRRVWVRYPVPDQTRGQLFNQQDSRSQHGTILNLSGGGLGLLLQEPVPLGTHLKVELEGWNGAHMLRCQVKFVTQQPEGWLHGCELSLPIGGTQLQDLLS